MSTSAAENATAKRKAEDAILPLLDDLTPEEVAQIGVLLISTAAEAVKENDGRQKSVELLNKAYCVVATLYVNARQDARRQG